MRWTVSLIELFMSYCLFATTLSTYIYLHCLSYPRLEFHIDSLKADVPAVWPKKRMKRSKLQMRTGTSRYHWSGDIVLIGNLYVQHLWTSMAFGMFNDLCAGSRSLNDGLTFGLDALDHIFLGLRRSPADCFGVVCPAPSIGTIVETISLWMGSTYWSAHAASANEQELPRMGSTLTTRVGQRS